MATLDLSKAKTSLQMDDPDLVGFNSVHGAPSSTAWSYITPGGNRVLVKGTNMTFDNGGRPNSGTATAVEIDVGNDGTIDLAVTGISVSANSVTLAALHGGPAGFWRLLLDGNDVILGPELAQGVPLYGEFVYFADGLAAEPGASAGSSDIVSAGDRNTGFTGDVMNVGTPTVGAPAADYHGGNDELLGHLTDAHQGMTGDAWRVYGGSRLTGGNDNFFIQSTNPISSVEGDAGDVVGEALGGNDYITAGKDFRGTLVGDVREAHPGSNVVGGDDTINGSDMGEHIVGDVYKLRGGRLAGGDDTINGGGGNDIIAGDAYEVRSDSTATGGDDLIRAGGGNAEVYGDAGYVGQGGNDTLYGESGNDRLHGEGGDDVLDGGTQSDVLYGGGGNDWLSGGADNDTLHGDAGDDQLDGGAGADLLAGLTGNDTYFVNDAGDVVYELAGFGVDTVWSILASYVLTANVEILRYNGAGNFAGSGNDLANTIAGSVGNDRLDGGDGNDVLIGGAGADALIGGDGVDTASYATATSGVKANLLGSTPNVGDADGDSYSGIENIAGSAFDDELVGHLQGNVLFGAAGRDYIDALSGNDVLIGGDGGDSLAGREGNDVLRGGRGADILYGGLGDDVFDFNGAAESAPGTRDVIRGISGEIAFEGAGAAGGDMIDLAGIDANAARDGNQAFVFGGTGIGRVSVASSGTSTLIRCNTDTDADFEFELLIDDDAARPSAYTAADFHL